MQKVKGQLKRTRRDVQCCSGSDNGHFSTQEHVVFRPEATGLLPTPNTCNQKLALFKQKLV